MFCRYLLSAMSCFQFSTNVAPQETVPVVTLTHCLLLIDQSKHVGGFNFIESFC